MTKKSEKKKRRRRTKRRRKEENAWWRKEAVSEKQSELPGIYIPPNETGVKRKSFLVAKTSSFHTSCSIRKRSNGT